MQIKATLRCLDTSSRIAGRKKTDNTNCWPEQRASERSLLVDGKHGPSTLEKRLVAFQKNTDLLYDLAIPLPGIFLRGMKTHDFYMKFHSCFHPKSKIVETAPVPTSEELGLSIQRNTIQQKEANNSKRYG